MDHREIAYHEAGHAVVHILYGHPIDKVTIQPDRKEGSLGHVNSVYGGIIEKHCLGDELQLELVRQLVRAAYAGFAAQRMYDERADRGGADQDYWQAAELADGFRIGKDLLRWQRRQIVAAEALVKKHRAAVRSVAEALFKLKTLAPSLARAIVSEHVLHVPEEIDYFHMLGELWESESVADMLCVTPGTLARWRREGRGPKCLRIGRYICYHVIPGPKGSATLYVVDR